LDANRFECLREKIENISKSLSSFKKYLIKNDFKKNF